MEHRYTGRMETSLDVVIYNMRGMNLKGCLCNVSREGMYIRTDGQRIRKGETLDIEVTNSCCLRGWVVHISDDGIGVLFVSPVPDESDSSSPPIPLPDECLNCLKIDG
jgi:hypothetical protein